MNPTNWLNRYCVDSKLKYPSIKTQENYQSSVKLFLYDFTYCETPSHIKTDDIKKWLLKFDTVNTRNHKLCAIKSFYEITVGMPLKLDKIPFSKKDKKLPIVLSVDEIQRMFDVCENKKHKVILALLYSCGLRVGELINLKWSHIDRSRMIINIIQAKGKKDRQVGLPCHIIPLLESYYFEYKTKEYVLNGQFTDKELRYSERSVNEVLKQLGEKAGIKKRIYAHLIRHCFATHSVENGTDINLLQKLLGHSNVKTTNIYLHISHNHISKINSPVNAIRL
jgi:site-specific recombinase XerD